MAKQRFINTRFWSDGFVVRLKKLARYLFLYFLTNEHTSICGVYELPEQTLKNESGFTDRELPEILKSLEGKVYYENGWVFIKNFAKHQKLNDSIKKGVEKALLELPAEILARYREIQQTGTEGDQTGTYSNLNLNRNLNLNSNKPISSSDSDSVKEKKKRKTAPHYSLIEYLFELKGWERNDLIAKQHLRPASDLLQACKGDVELAKAKILKVKQWADVKVLDWNLSTILKRWFELDAETAAAPKKPYIDGCPAYQNKRGDWMIINHDGQHLKHNGSLSEIKYV